MKTIVLIDDEFFFRKALYAFIEKQSSYKIIGDANNGETGRKLVLDLKPDIALVDISMPVMDGLEMIQSLYSLTHTRFILLTGYSDFDYARQAISLGVSDYLLKPLDYEELLKALHKLSKEIDLQHQQQDALSDYYQYRELYLSQMNLNTFHKILSSSMRQEEFSDFLHESPLKSCHAFMVFMIKISNSEKNVWNLETENTLCHFILKNICLEVLEHQKIPALYIDTGAVVQCVICGFTEDTISHASELPTICRHLMKIFKDTAHLAASILLGTLHYGMQGIKASYEEALSLLHNSPYKDLTFFKIYENSEPEQFLFNESASVTFHELLILLRQHRTETIQSFISQHFDKMQQEMTHIKKIQLSAAIFITVLNDFLSECSFSSSSFPILQHALDNYEACQSTEDLKNLILDTYVKVLDELELYRSSSKNQIVQNAQDYISKHYMEPDLHLDTIASALYVSSQYLCTTFSREANITLGNYLTNFRMQKAKELLLSNHPSVQNTALLCGFTDAGYFSKCFKKHYGISPKKFLSIQNPGALQ